MRITTVLAVVAIGAMTTAPTSGFTRSFEPWNRPAKAPIGSLQPRSKDFSAGTPADRAEQRRLSRFDARKKTKNRKLDQKLNICRC